LSVTGLMIGAVNAAIFGVAGLIIVIAGLASIVPLRRAAGTADVAPPSTAGLER